MSADTVDLIGDLLRDWPPVDAPDEERAVWLARKADVLDAIATEADAIATVVEVPGLVDPVEARNVAEKARNVAEKAREALRRP